MVNGAQMQMLINKGTSLALTIIIKYNYRV